MSGRALMAATRKECRALVPAGAACAAVLTGCAVLNSDLPPTYLLLLFGFGALTIGTHAVGQEFSNGTLATTLTLPVSRSMLLVIKLLVTAVLLVAVGAIAGWTTSAWSSGEGGVAEKIVWITLAALCLAPPLTMAAGNALAGSVFTIATPAVIWLALYSVGWLRHGHDPEALDRFTRELFGPSLMVASVAGLVAAIVLFQRLEANESRGRELHLPVWRRSAASRARDEAQHPWIWQLVRKELRLQHLTLTITSIFAVAAGVQAIILWVYPQSSTWHIMPLTVLHAIAGATLAGALAAAEERQLGMWPAQVMLPIAAWQTWIVKVAVAFAVTAVLGVGLMAAVRFLMPGAFQTSIFRLGLLTALLVVTSFSLYVSSLAPNGMRAIVGIILTLFVLGSGFRSLAHLVTSAVRSVVDPSPSLWLLGARQEILFTIAAMLVLILLTLGYRNFQRSSHTVQTIALQGTALLAVVVVFVAVLSVI